MDIGWRERRLHPGGRTYARTSLLGDRQVASADTANTSGMDVVAKYMRRMRLTGRVSRQAR